ncbi:hypothetical protein IGB42_03433 [Andreprevotia sp. IGB-42]|uniref:DUF4124 domain-containing protein n=1 Tax=Andreprevotia sp. IGB-42 TaxID=2497473 RepID=UPI00157F6D90|nr:DUF4124 domain-containing protein [Andreprevotia sp. IGB-42]KAF0812155.1 hypothetical protein IGB42_03433 [Andreprevotia sp. IGB-42]
MKRCHVAMCRSMLRATLVLAALAIANPASAAMYKCKEASGSTSYSETPCTGKALPIKSGTLSVVPPAPARQAAVDTAATPTAVPSITPLPVSATPSAVPPAETLKPAVGFCDPDSRDYDSERCTPNSPGYFIKQQHEKTPATR